MLAHESIVIKQLISVYKNTQPMARILEDHIDYLNHTFYGLHPRTKPTPYDHAYIFLVGDTVLSAIVVISLIAIVMNVAQLAFTSLSCLIFLCINLQQALESSKSIYNVQLLGNYHVALCM